MKGSTVVQEGSFLSRTVLNGTRLIADNVMFVGDRRGRAAND